MDKCQTGSSGDYRKNPHPLSYSLYKLLVLDSSWIKARKLMGYSAYFEKIKT